MPSLWYCQVVDCRKGLMMGKMSDVEVFNLGFARAARILMHARGIEFGELAELTGLHIRSLTEILDGRRCGLWQGDLIATGLDIPLDFLCGWVAQPGEVEAVHLVPYRRNILAGLPPVTD